jgi:hypothetical protein
VEPVPSLEMERVASGRASGIKFWLYCIVVDSVVENIVKFPSLSVSELTLFRSCLAWSVKECERRGIATTPDNQRTVLGNALSFIRFPTLSLRDFANEVSRTGVLTAEDRCAVFEYLACRGDTAGDEDDDETKNAWYV